MKKTFLITFLFFISCKKSDVKIFDNENSKLCQKLEDIKFIYYLDYHNSKSYNNLKLDRLRIIDKTSNKVFQTIKFENIEISKSSSSFFDVEDVNFDGINDLSVLNFIGAYTTSSSFWIFYKKIKQFVHYKKMDEIQNPVILKNKKEICSSWHSALSEFHLEKYFWNKDSIMLKENYEESWLATGRGHLKISKLENGNWIISEKEIKEHFVENMKCE